MAILPSSLRVQEVRRVLKALRTRNDCAEFVSMTPKRNHTELIGNKASAYKL